MKKIDIADITLREEATDKNFSLSFKEKIDIARQLDKLNIDVIETSPITKGKTDILFLHTISPLVKNSTISCPVGLSEESIKETYEAIKTAKKPRLHIMMPVSTVQMEYMCHKKPKMVLEMIGSLVKCAKSLCDEVEVSMLDATRAEEDFLVKAIDTAIDNGAKIITVCDSAGAYLPTEFEEFLNNLFKKAPKIKEVKLSVECSNELHMAAACAISCIGAGITQIKTVMASKRCPSLKSVAHVFKAKSDSLGIKCGINMTVLDNSIKQMNLITNTNENTNSPFDSGTGNGISSDIKLSANDDITTVSKAVEKMGYDISDEDVTKVFEAFRKVSEKKAVGAKELDAIVASVAMQVAPTYKLKSYVINNGNIITATAHIEMEKNGEMISGFCIGDGPVDASFMAIEQITGHHYELDDFQIQAVTEGHEAMGESVVKLRYDGKLFSGRGISTDIIGASINAYINALNKICFEEEM